MRLVAPCVYTPSCHRLFLAIATISTTLTVSYSTPGHHPSPLRPLAAGGPRKRFLSLEKAFPDLLHHVWPRDSLAKGHGNYCYVP
uniref:Putative secreted protein n=1 Tax=Anopheles darlingi TaxID=43151 RepID=A0A2M4DIL2_ANODA